MTATATAGQLHAETERSGRFVRQPNAFTDRLIGESGRYHLYACLACPWAHRAIIARELKGLQEVVTLSLVDPIRDERGWAFNDADRSSDGTDYADPVNSFAFLGDAYRASDPDFEGRFTVPTVWDRVAGRIASNDYPEIPVQFDHAFGDLADPEAPFADRLLYAEDGRWRELSDEIFHSVNNGVYRAGFATSQEAYEESFDELFALLDRLDRRLADRRYLLGDELSGVDIHLFTTLVRFDAVYHGHFKCNLRRLVDYPNLWPYARDLYQTPAFGSTTDFDQIKRHYYATHEKLNPLRIVPKGPAVDWTQPAGR